MEQEVVDILADSRNKRTQSRTQRNVCAGSYGLLHLLLLVAAGCFFSSTLLHLNCKGLFDFRTLRTHGKSPTSVGHWTLHSESTSLTQRTNSGGIESAPNTVCSQNKTFSARVFRRTWRIEHGVNSNYTYAHKQNTHTCAARRTRTNTHNLPLSLLHAHKTQLGRRLARTGSVCTVPQTKKL